MAITEIFKSRARKLSDALVKEISRPFGKWAIPGQPVRDDQRMLDLIEQGANLTRRDGNGWTMLQRASFFGAEAIIQTLIDKGADMNARDTGKNSSDETALMLAAQKGHAGAVKILLAAGSDPNAVNKYGGTALHACSWDAATMKVLIAGGGDVNKRNDSGCTPLMTAVRSSEDPAAALALIAAGADLDAANSDGWNALAIARGSQAQKPEAMRTAIEKVYADRDRRAAEAEAQRKRDIEEMARTAAVAQRDITVSKKPLTFKPK